MALLSLIVPAYRVQGYLRECLDSMLGQSLPDQSGAAGGARQSFAELEVVVVDDCSPDSSGQIMAEYAARDPRVRVVSLPGNIGAGPARDAGLAQATGEYVWFIDGDDWLAPGALRAVVHRLLATRPDVLLVNHMRVDWDPRRKPDPHSDFLHQAPEVFTLDQWPKAIDVLHVAWNKVVRREFLAGLGLRFTAGWYEDVPFTYPLLLAADRISTLDRVCVNYRRRRVGAITGTGGDHHFDIFDQWELAFAYLDGAPPERAERAELLRPYLFRRMIWHFLMVLGNESRISFPLRRRFFARVIEHYRRYLPPGGYLRPGGVEGAKHQLVARGAYGMFEALRVGYRAASRSREAAGGLRRTGRRWARGVLRGGRDALLRAYYRVQLRLPRDESLAVFGAYWYRGYACNPAAIYDKARELAPSVRGVWVVRRDRAQTMPPGVDHVIAGSRAYYRALARASWLINNVNFPDFVVKRPGAVHLMTHHGTPLKVMGLDEYGYPARFIQDAVKGGPKRPDEVGALMRRCDRWDFSVAQNAFTTQVFERAYPCRYQTLEVGYPRNDRLANATPEQVAAARRKLGLAPGQNAILYAPTHREYHLGYRPPLDVEGFAEELDPDTVVLARAHYFYVRGSTAAGGDQDLRQGRVMDVSTYPVVEDLYLAADALITDYSSLMFDYAVLDRPIVIYASDWEVYRTIRGVTFDLPAEPPGAVATTYRGLVDMFTTGAYRGDPASKARAQFRARFCALEDGRAAERVVRRVFESAAAAG